MLIKTHLAFGVLLGMLLIGKLELGLIGFAGVLFGSIFPDIDCSFSKVGRKWYVRVVMWMTKHRGVLHSLLFAVFACFLLGIFSYSFGVGFFVGYAGHLFLDCLTLQGIGLFWPFRFRIKGGFRAGKLFDNLLFAGLVFVDVWLAVKILLEIFNKGIQSVG